MRAPTNRFLSTLEESSQGTLEKEQRLIYAGNFRNSEGRGFAKQIGDPHVIAKTLRVFAVRKLLFK